MLRVVTPAPLGIERLRQTGRCWVLLVERRCGCLLGYLPAIRRSNGTDITGNLQRGKALGAFPL